jgi:hypothetical protein
MSGVDWVLESEDCNRSGLESEQPGPQPHRTRYFHAADTPLSLKTSGETAYCFKWTRACVGSTAGSIDTTSPASCIQSLAEAQEPREQGEARALGLTSDREKHRSR